MTNLLPEDLFEVNVIITQMHNKPAIEIRTRTTNPKILRSLISAAYRRQPLIVLPKFTNHVKSLASCIEKGIIYLDHKDNKYKFTF